MSNRERRNLCFSALFVLVAVQVAFAFTTTGTTGQTVGSDFYEAAIGISQGYIGKTIAVGGLASGLFMLYRAQILPAVGCAVAGIGFSKLAAIADTMGFVI